ncbi:hypothetical protein H8N00_12630 [Streptomyces sp. AC563]|nr:hypothetical protein [Streptomyces buecherae]MBC3989703.1 hypothetical protein [Streptomyces buecherae]
MEITTSQISELRTLAGDDDTDQGVSLVVPAGTTGCTTAAVVIVDE